MRSKNTTSGQHRSTFTEAARRAQIIECTIETLAVLGYAQTSLAHIAERAGINKGLILYYFTSKEELMRQVVTQIYTVGALEMSQAIEAAPRRPRPGDAAGRPPVRAAGPCRPPPCRGLRRGGW